MNQFSMDAPWSMEKITTEQKKLRWRWASFRERNPVQVEALGWLSCVALIVVDSMTTNSNRWIQGLLFLMLVSASVFLTIANAWVKANRFVKQ